MLIPSNNQYLKCVSLVMSYVINHVIELCFVPYIVILEILGNHEIYFGKENWVERYPRRTCPSCKSPREYNQYVKK